MTDLIIDLSDTENDRVSYHEVVEYLTPDLIVQLKTRFGLVGETTYLQKELGKVLWRFQGANHRQAEEKPDQQRKKVAQLASAIEKSIEHLEALSDENLSAIDGAIMRNGPFNNGQTLEVEQAYWDYSINASIRTKSRLIALRDGIRTLQDDWKEAAGFRVETRNTPLDDLIKDLAQDFERGSDRKAKSHCYNVATTGGGGGQFFDFIKFMVSRFAPKLLHSDGALSNRINRCLRDSDRRRTESSET